MWSQQNDNKMPPRPKAARPAAIEAIESIVGPSRNNASVNHIIF